MLRNSKSSSSGNRNGCLRLTGSGDFVAAGPGGGFYATPRLQSATAMAFFFKWQLIRPDLRHSRHCQSSLARSRALLRCVPDCRSARLGGIEGRSCTQQSGRGVAPAAVRGTWWWHVRMACCRRMAHAVVQNAANKTAEHGNTERRTEIREIRHGHGHGQKKMRVFRSVFDSRKNTEKNVFNSPASAFAVT